MQKYYTRTEAARLLNMSGRSVWAKLKSGEIKGTQNEENKRWFIPGEELARYMGLRGLELEKSEEPAEIVSKWLIQTGRGDYFLSEYYTPTYREVIAQEGKGIKSAQDEAKEALNEAIKYEIDNAGEKALRELYAALAINVLNNMDVDDVSRLLLNAKHR